MTRFWWTWPTPWRTAQHLSGPICTSVYLTFWRITVRHVTLRHHFMAHHFLTHHFLTFATHYFMDNPLVDSSTSLLGTKRMGIYEYPHTPHSSCISIYSCYSFFPFFFARSLLAGICARTRRPFTPWRRTCRYGYLKNKMYNTRPFFEKNWKKYRCGTPGGRATFFSRRQRWLDRGRGQVKQENVVLFFPHVKKKKN